MITAAVNCPQWTLLPCYCVVSLTCLLGSTALHRARARVDNKEWLFVVGWIGCDDHLVLLGHGRRLHLLELRVEHSPHLGMDTTRWYKSMTNNESSAACPVCHVCARPLPGPLTSVIPEPLQHLTFFIFNTHPMLIDYCLLPLDSY